jgi:hypothetical protein
VTFSDPASTGDAHLDGLIWKAADGLRQSIEGALQTWAEMTLEPLHDQETYAKDCIVEKAGDGFTVYIKSPDCSLKEFFTQDDKLSEVMGTVGERLIDITPHYTKSEKGLVVAAYEVTAGKQKTSFQCETETVGGFLLLKRMVCSAKMPNLPGDGLSFVLSFFNYKINQ